MMASLRMFGAHGLLLIFIALGTNGQQLTEKIPLGKVFLLFMEILVMEKKYSAASVMSCRGPFFPPSSSALRSSRRKKNTSIPISFHNTTKKGFALWLFFHPFRVVSARARVSFVPVLFARRRAAEFAQKKGWKEGKQTEITYEKEKRFFVVCLGQQTKNKKKRENPPNGQINRKIATHLLH